MIAGRTLKNVRAARGVERLRAVKRLNPAWGAYVVPRAGLFF